MRKKRLRKVLIISKMTELEFDEFKYGSAVEEHYRRRRVDVSRLEENHEYHYRSLDAIVKAFRENGVRPGIIKKQNLGRSDFREGWDLVVPTGGDGTFMDAARYVHDGTLFFGIKSTPRSVGGHYGTNFSNAAEHIRKVLRGDYAVERRTRIEGTVAGELEVRDLALNDIYCGDRYVVGYSRLELRIGGRTIPANGNGIIFSTFHGRTGWYDNIPVPERAARPGRRGRAAAPRLAASCDFAAEEESVVKFKILMRDRKDVSDFPDHGVLRAGEECVVHSRVLNHGCVSFDGSKTSRPRHRMYDLPYSGSVTIRVSDRPLLVVRP